MARVSARLSPDISLYLQIEAVLRDQIADGVLRPSDRLPSEEDLCSQFAVSRGPVRQALDALERDGLIERTPGRGTFVRAAAQRQAGERAIEPWSDLIRSGVERASRLTLIGSSIPPSIVGRSLSLASNVEVPFFIRLFGNGAAPVGIKRYLHPDLAGHVDRLAAAKDFDRRIADAAGAACHVGNVWAEAILAEPRFAMQLKVPLGSPLLSVWWTLMAEDRIYACTQMLQPGAAAAVAMYSKGTADGL